MPDALLFAQAAAGALQTRDAIYLQAQGMLGDPRALRMMRGFHARYAQLDSVRYQSASKDPDRFPAFSDTAVAAMRTAELLVTATVDSPNLVAEIELGLALLPKGKRKTFLSQGWTTQPSGSTDLSRVSNTPGCGSVG
jgi:hypothetical protein